MIDAAVIDEERTAMSEDVMSGDQLAALVRESILRAVRGGVSSVDSEHDDGEQVIVGVGVRAVIERSVTETIKDLLGQHVLLSGPLRDLSVRLNETVSEADEVWQSLRELEELLDARQTDAQPTAVPAVAPVAQPTTMPAVAQVAPPTPREPKLIAMQPRQKKCACCSTRLTDENVSRRGSGSYCVSCLPGNEPPKKQEDPKREEPKQEPKTVVQHDSENGGAPTTSKVVMPASFEDREDGVVIGGRLIPFRAKASPEFKAFFREFAAKIAAGPVRPNWVLRLAADHGYGHGEKNPKGAVRGTVVYQIEDYLGSISKWKDDVGDQWWSLPSDDGGVPVGGRNR